MKESIAVDMDGVIADVEAHAISLYKRDYGIALTKYDLLGKEESEMLPDGLFYRLIREKGVFRNVPVMEGAIEALKRLCEEFDVYIVSAAMEFPQSLSEKREWLSENFPFISWKQIVFCGDKSIIKTDYMIDDHPKNLDNCYGKPLMFSAFHNHGKSQHLRFNDWRSILNFFEKGSLVQN